jgi:hypothetical protein
VNPISWIPLQTDVDRLLSADDLLDLWPIVPSQEVLAQKADLINRILREANVKDEYRPAYVGAMMLALLQSKGAIRKDEDFVLRDINTSCEDTFRKADKQELGKSLRIDEANRKLASSAWRILATLEKLNVVTASFDHDYLGQLYACIQRAFDFSKAKYEDIIDMVKYKLIGFENEPVTAALCVANMILRGDGKTGIKQEDCFVAEDYPIGKCHIALMNPPFPHRNTDDSIEIFCDRALESLEAHGKLAVIIPTNLIVKKDKGDWRENILKENSLEAVCQLPDELFQPYASSTTSVILIRKGVPHDKRRKTTFVRIQYDGLTLKKGTRVPRLDGKNQINDAINAILNKTEAPGFSGTMSVSQKDEWSPGAYIPSALPRDDEIKASVDELLRRLASFYTRFAAEILNQRRKINNDEIIPQRYQDMVGKKRLSNAEDLPHETDTIGEFFDIFYGQKELHSREHISQGDSLIISPTEEFNGCYGWLYFEKLLTPPFVTVAQTGSIGESFVQLEPCGVNDDCLVLLPRDGYDFPISCFFIAAAIIRLEKWRFNYGRKLTPARISSFVMKRMPILESWVDDELTKWKSIFDSAIEIYQ